MTGRALTRVARLGAALALGAGLLVASGCGDSGEGGDIAAGKTTFQNLCAQCHTLADSGKPPAYVGPNLDDAFRAARDAGFDQQQFAGVVERWIDIAQQPMPRDLVTGQDAVNVAAYVAAVAGKSPASAVHESQQTTPEAPSPARQDLHPPS